MRKRTCSAYAGETNVRAICCRHSCGLSCGVYLVIKAGFVLILHANTGCFLPPPYVDEHGEHDLGLVSWKWWGGHALGLVVEM